MIATKGKYKDEMSDIKALEEGEDITVETIANLSDNRGDEDVK